MRFLTIFILSLTTVFNTALAQTFSDVAPNDWPYPYVEDLVAQGIIDEGYFYHPYNPLTRAELVKIMVLATTGILDDRFPEYSYFPDVKVENWYYPYVQTAKITGLIDGYPDGNFRPGNLVNRAEAMKIIINGLGIAKSVNPPVHFRDYDSSEWFHIYVATAYNNEIIQGQVNTKGNKQMLFGPSENISRAEMAKVTSMGLSVSSMY
jgi:hypothetical protein